MGGMGFFSIAHGPLWITVGPCPRFILIPTWMPPWYKWKAFSIHSSGTSECSHFGVLRRVASETVVVPRSSLIMFSASCLCEQGEDSQVGAGTVFSNYENSWEVLRRWHFVGGKCVVVTCYLGIRWPATWHTGNEWWKLSGILDILVGT